MCYKMDLLLLEEMLKFDNMIPLLMQKGLERQAVGRETSPSLAEAAVRAAAEAKSKAVRHPRVLLYGFLPRQAQDIIERSAGFKLDVFFVQKEGRLLEPPPSCQWCVFMNKTGHPAWHKMKKNFGDKIFLVEGTSEALKKLADINALVNTLTK